jgi:hypothetical protein
VVVFSLKGEEYRLAAAACAHHGAPLRYVDLADAERTMAFNPLAGADPALAERIALAGSPGTGDEFRQRRDEASWPRFDEDERPGQCDNERDDGWMFAAGAGRQLQRRPVKLGQPRDRNC